MPRMRKRSEPAASSLRRNSAVVLHHLPPPSGRSLADGWCLILALPPPISVQRSHGFTRPTTRRGAECAPPTVKPLYLPTYFRLAASGSRGKSGADNQPLRLHRPQATVSPTAVSYSFLEIRSLKTKQDDGSTCGKTAGSHVSAYARPKTPRPRPAWGGVKVLVSSRRRKTSVLRVRANCGPGRLFTA